MPWMFAGIGDRDAKPVVGARDGDRDDALQGLAAGRARPRRATTRSSWRSMNGRPWRRASERAMPVGLASPRPAAPRRATRRRPDREPPRAGRDGTISVAATSSRDEIGDRLEAAGEPSASASHDPSPARVAEVRGRAKWAGGLEVHGFPSTEVSAETRARLSDASSRRRGATTCATPSVPRYQSSRSRRRRRAPRLAPKARNGTNGIAIFRAFEPCRIARSDGRHERDQEPDHQRDGDRPGRASRRAGSASLTSPMPRPFG